MANLSTVSFILERSWNIETLENIVCMCGVIEKTTMISKITTTTTTVSATAAARNTVKKFFEHVAVAASFDVNRFFCLSSGKNHKINSNAVWLGSKSVFIIEIRT